jgi:hypothetical protein
MTAPFRRAMFLYCARPALEYNNAVSIPSDKEGLIWDS